MTEPVIIVHGGAGEWPESKRNAAIRGVKAAADQGWRVLAGEGTSKDAVQAAVMSMEDDSIFNAGRGSALNLGGYVEMDASIMEGKGLTGGGVGMVRGIKNPVKLARIVLEETDHVLIVGRGAELLAKARHLPRSNPKVDSRTKAWKRGISLFKRGRVRHLPRNRKLFTEGLLGRSDTVGALALDSSGDLAAACSTGGLSLKLPGRIGDSAIIGAGLYADNRLGAATATGIGELAIRTALAKSACELMGKTTAKVAAERCIRLAAKRVGRGLGVITLDPGGKYGVAHSTRHLCWAAVSSEGGLRSSMSGSRL